MTPKEAKALTDGTVLCIKPFSELMRKHRSKKNKYIEDIPDITGGYPSWVQKNYFWPNGEDGKDFSIENVQINSYGASFFIGLYRPDGCGQWWFSSEDFMFPEPSVGISDEEFDALF